MQEVTQASEDVFFQERESSHADMFFHFFNVDGTILNLNAERKELGKELRLSEDPEQKKKLRKEITLMTKQIKTRLFYKTDFSDSKLDLLVDMFKEWMREPLHLQFDNIETGESEFHLAAKRGNGVYKKLVMNKVENHTRFMNKKSFNDYLMNDRKTKTKTLFVTLTWNPNIFLGSRHRAWSSLTYYFNKFAARLRKKYGKVFILRGTESTKKAFPHIHLLLIFKEKEFDVLKINGVYRIKQKEEVSKMWNHFVDVVVPANANAVASYIVKDVIKQYSRTNKRTHQDFLSLALCFIYKLQAYSISDSSDLIRICIIKTQTEEILKKSNLIFRGIVRIEFSLDFLSRNKPPDRFKVKLTPEKEESCRSFRICEPRL